MVDIYRVLSMFKCGCKSNCNDDRDIKEKEIRDKQIKELIDLLYVIKAQGIVLPLHINDEKDVVNI